MQVICPGCGAAFRCSGLSHHIRQSKDPHCYLPGLRQSKNQDDSSATPVLEPAVTNTNGNELEEPVMNTDENNPEDQHRFHISIDPLGDLFGDYAKYKELTLIADGEGDQAMDDDIEGEDLGHPTDAQEEEAEAEAEAEAELHEALLAEEYHLEPERPPQQPDTLEQEQEDTPSENAQAPFRLRGGFERPLYNPPEIMKFSDHNAGTVYERTHQIGNLDYCQAVSNADGPNLYAPFASKLDWEVAHWAKMQGLGSNALTEPLHIEGVSFPTYDNEIRSELLI